MDDNGEEDDCMQIVLEEMGFDEVMLGAFNDSASEEEEKQWGGSRQGKAPNKDRDFQDAYNRFVRMYFNGRQSTYNEKDFERRFRCPRSVFNKIHCALLYTAKHTVFFLCATKGVINNKPIVIFFF